MSRAQILIVQYEADLRRLVSDLLKRDGYGVETSGDGLEAQKLAMTQPFDLIILDVILPSKSGFDVCRYLRNKGINTPILMLTERTELNDKVEGLRAGGDDYLTKPFETPELQVRVEALLRRAFPAARPDLETYDFDDVHVDFTKGRVTKKDKAMDLGERQCRLLRYLVERKGVVLSRDELLQEVWGYKSIPRTRTVDVHIAWLRKKIEGDPKKPQYVVTVYGQGYRFAG
jgi:two-component system alkaline phosphatase synthesis response regulator PhoP